MRQIGKVCAITLAGALLFAYARPIWAQDETVTTATKLRVDEKTGPGFAGPGPGRVPQNRGGMIDQRTRERQLALTTNDQVRAAVAQSQVQQRADTYLANFQNNSGLGTLAYLDYSFYLHIGFGPGAPAEYESVGPANNSFNSFDIIRVYLT